MIDRVARGKSRGSSRGVTPLSSAVRPTVSRGWEEVITLRLVPFMIIFNPKKEKKKSCPGSEHRKQSHSL